MIINHYSGVDTIDKVLAEYISDSIHSGHIKTKTL